ncbi:helix-turn-helix domain-containing protein [Neomicrococcus aestuarii]|uniref:Transcriptional regulator with XRE-family HTH domain n=1 Tax=Neomicrococcus aestuarii TaxID=556325 RepID=A0A1L2ZN22_9MICC|nr:helix-turn-helix domain-containing protein [Neomicrococcus aestuarii]APF40590.1 XRE family transcriptional regulator [Neomicrococcus aestuarii]MBB5512282.1 transcriptional regulator with XRE-family HTH domain [Neomicrococcus aestuarii]
MKAIELEAGSESLAIGARLRAARKQSRLTMDQVAEATGLTKGFLSRVERDLTSPSVATLLNLCKALSIDVGSLFEEPPLKVVRRSEARKINLGGQGIDERLLTGHGERRVQVIRADIEPYGEGEAELYSVDCEVEVLHVVEGEFVIRFSRDTIELSAGDTVTYPGREPHSWRNPSGERAVVLWTLVPAAAHSGRAAPSY